MKEFQIRPLDKGDRDWIVCLLEEYWGSTKIVTRGRIHHADELPGFVAVQGGKPVGLVTYKVEGEECEVVTMNSLIEGIGIGSTLLEAVKQVAASSRCKRLWLITTNDNTAALHLLSLVAVHRNALEQSRRLKPEIPLVGTDGIPLRDEIELELLL